MPSAQRVIPPEAIAENRYLYEETATPRREIAARLKISETTLGLRVHEWGWRPRRVRQRRAPPAAPSEQPAPAPAPDPVIVDDSTAAERIQRTVERELAMIEAIVARLEPPSGKVEQAERAARVLASLTRTLQEVVRLTAPAPNEQNDDDRGPDDPDEFLRELARRMDAFAAAAARPVPDDAASGGT